MKIQYYIRYADDFVILSEDRKWLFDILAKIKDFLWNELHLQLHPDKVSLWTIASGVDFLGWVHFPDHRILRTTTKRKMLHSIRAENGKIETVRSYFGLLSHGNTITLQRKIEGLVDASLAGCDKKRYAGGMKITVSVKPNAKKDLIEIVGKGQYVVQRTATPTQGKANDALIKLLAAYFDIARSRITVVLGKSSRRKIIEII